MSAMRPKLAFAMGATARAPTELAAHLVKSAPRTLQEMSALVAPVSSKDSLNLRGRYEDLAMRFSTLSPKTDIRTFNALVSETLKDAGKCGLEPTAMDVLPEKIIPLEAMKPFLERRISLRFLMSHYEMLRHKGNRYGHVGLFERQCKLAVLCRSAALKIQLLCMRKYDRTPTIRVEETGTSQAVITAVPQPIQFAWKSRIIRLSSTSWTLQVACQKIQGRLNFGQ
eukprot:GEMP01066336.1.p1 GENE.GEMP01066336.1~~GEMP01066336.1.p1  ORF type:complete len:226 (+),score=33.53 GEMP01066336.1:125-802(+)